MAGSSFGTLFKITTWGESHGKGIGVVVDGIPAGLSLEEADIQPFLDRRKPGQSRFTTKRAESDTVEILSGVFEGKTTGAPVSMVVMNKDQRSGDYGNIAETYRPGHADFGFDMKFGFRDYRGGGRSSGRETIARVAGGAVAIKVLKELGISVTAYASQIGPFSIDPASKHFSLDERDKNALAMPDADTAAKAAAYLDEMIAQNNSAGGIVECVVSGLPAGIGDPVFDKLDANLGKALFSIGAVKGVEIGDGFRTAASTGAENNDPFGNGDRIHPLTNHAGGVLGGISSGADLLVRAAFKPTPSIASPQQTVKKDGTPVTLEISGRHDPIIVPRAVVVVEAMTAVTILDLLLTGMGSKMDNLKKIWAAAE